jgi:hypothetical protein
LPGAQSGGVVWEGGESAHSKVATLIHEWMWVEVNAFVKTKNLLVR